VVSTAVVAKVSPTSAPSVLPSPTTAEPARTPNAVQEPLEGGGRPAGFLPLLALGLGVVVLVGALAFLIGRRVGT
jgi:hypothetical protein